MISHNVDLLADVVNRVWFLDAVRGEADVYNMGWQKYLDARATDEQRRRRERANAEKQGRRRCGPRPPRWAPRPPKPLPHRTCCAEPTG